MRSKDFPFEYKNKNHEKIKARRYGQGKRMQSTYCQEIFTEPVFESNIHTSSPSTFSGQYRDQVPIV